jgi:hypothetical protein
MKSVFQGLNTLGALNEGHGFSRAVEGLTKMRALYQGTTLVGPLKPSKDEGFSP